MTRTLLSSLTALAMLAAFAGAADAQRVGTRFGYNSSGFSATMGNGSVRSARPNVGRFATGQRPRTPFIGTVHTYPILVWKQKCLDSLLPPPYNGC